MYITNTTTRSLVMKLLLKGDPALTGIEAHAILEEGVDMIM